MEQLNAIANYSNKTGIPIEQINIDEATAQPIRRIENTKNVAELIYFISQNVVTYMTGVLIPIDGGYTTQ